MFILKHVFVVDDEKNIRDLIEKYLIKDGFKVTTFDQGTHVVSEMRRLEPDLLVLDINMPGIDGLEVCKEVRKISEIPIIFVSARDEEFDRILGLELGGDDYLSKPFSPRELMVRIKNIFKRLEKTLPKTDVTVVKDLQVYFDRRFVEKDGTELKLTTKEYELFEFFVKNKNMPFTREHLIEKIWGYDYLGDLRVIDDLVKRLRKKLKDLDSEVKIETVWGFGYKIEG